MASSVDIPHSAVNENHSASLSSKKKLFKYLQDLKNLKYSDYDVARASVAKAERALLVLFYTGKKNIYFTEKEKRDLGNLLTDVIVPIMINIKSCSFFHRTRLQLSVLMKRSALQFLVEKYAEFPAKDSTLKNELEKANIQQSMKILDEIIETCRDYTDSDEVDSDPERAGISDIPATHSWWFL